MSTNLLKYAIAKQEQELKKLRRKMFSCKPGSVDHLVKIIVYDRKRMEFHIERNRLQEKSTNNVA